MSLPQVKLYELKNKFQNILVKFFIFKIMFEKGKYLDCDNVVYVVYIFTL